MSGPPSAECLAHFAECDRPDNPAPVWYVDAEGLVRHDASDPRWIDTGDGLEVGHCHAWCESVCETAFDGLVCHDEATNRGHDEPLRRARAR